MKPAEETPNSLTDEILCLQAASGDRIAEETLVMRYNRLVRICARPYFLAGGDSEDLIQEGMVGLLNAIREYVPQRVRPFGLMLRYVSAIVSCPPSGRHLEISTLRSTTMSLSNPLF